MNNTLNITEEQARAISFAFTAYREAMERMAASDLTGYACWNGMANESLAKVFGMTRAEIHDYGHFGTKPGQQRPAQPARLDYIGRLRADSAFKPSSYATDSTYAEGNDGE